MKTVKKIRKALVEYENSFMRIVESCKKRELTESDIKILESLQDKISVLRWVLNIEWSSPASEVSDEPEA